MPTQMTIFIGVQCLAIVVFSAVGLVAARNRQRILHGIIASPEGEARSFQAYLRYVAERMRLLLAVRRINIYILIVPAFFVGFSLATSAYSSAIIPMNGLMLLPALFALIIGMLVGALLHDIVGSVTGDAEALSLFRINNLQSHDILVQKLRRTLISTLPTILYLEALGIVLMLGNMGYTPFFLLLGLAAVGFVLRTAFAPSLRAWMTSVRPIEQTEWVYLVPRIAAWAQLADMTFANIVVQQDQVGDANVRIVGLGRPTLILSEGFLRATEWRQQDAAIGIAIGLERKHILRGLSLYNGIIIAISVLFLTALSLTNSLASALSMDTYTIFLGVLVLYFLVRLVQTSSRRSLRAKYFDVDRIAAYLTGDPVGVMVALHTFNVLNGVPVVLRSTNVPSTNERISMLDALVRTPWPRAPYAALPVPAIAQVTIGQYMLTTPFSPNRDVSQVPEQPYVQLV